jgi:hypothetical protein
VAGKKLEFVVTDSGIELTMKNPTPSDQEFMSEPLSELDVLVAIQDIAGAVAQMPTAGGAPETINTTLASAYKDGQPAVFLWLETTTVLLSLTTATALAKELHREIEHAKKHTPKS